MIEAKNLVKKFKSYAAVADVSFQVGEGENLVLLGTSGCGKTTTLRMLNKLEEPDAGSVQIDGVDIKHKPGEALRRGIGYVLQHHGLFPHYTVAENIAVVPKLLGWSAAKTQDRIHETLSKLKLQPAEVSHVYPHQLSGGQQQRIGLARALAADPPILLMDEPFGALDPITRVSIRKDFLALEDLKKKTMVMVTHDVQEAFEMADKICLMHRGQVMQYGTPQDLLFKPANAFVSRFLDEQRMQLELKSVKYTQVAPFVENENREWAGDDDASVWEVLEQANSKVAGNPATAASTPGVAVILNAWLQYKNNQYAG